ncbi:MAG: orotidine-5'-phosphate decarboxylase [Candidatus Pacebacteria bacterium]|nr:orotidine-5'-phosphate decarboxylase [Candidatus Paceibacterota bacterium]
MAVVQKQIPRGIWCALDLPDAESALRMVRLVSPQVVGFKIGMELFYRSGPELVARIADAAAEAAGERRGIFLDLKLHDIPNTVAAAARSLSRLPIDLLTVHASGGAEMVAAAVAGIAGNARIIAVTVLTSLDDQNLDALGFGFAAGELAIRLGRMAVSAGAAGLVCSGLEVAALHREVGPQSILVVPGLRMADSKSAGDQKRIVTPLQALQNGGVVLVVGRPITAAADPAAAARLIAQSLI